MPRFRVYLTTSASAMYVIEADDLEAAEMAAEDLEAPGLCAQCSGWGRDNYLDLGDEWEVEIAEIEDTAPTSAP